MGVVYKAHDAILDRIVAIKQMAGDLDDDPQLRQRFIQEARSAARLNHRNIVTIYELHESEHDIYIVMELLEGVDLATLLKRKVPMPLEARLNMMAQLCDGLEYAHAKGIIHRDIKPANLHVSPAGVVTILDFGIARLAASKMTSTGGLIGTPDYMSPEQVMAGKLDARSDLFAVGAVIYELLSGYKPFEAESVTALLMKIVREPHVPLRDRAPYLPQGAIDLVERLLQKNPDDRPSSAKDVQQALLSISTDKSPLDAGTVAILSTVVMQQQQQSKTPLPPTRPAAKPPTMTPRASDESQIKLASLAIERGRALREAGDLGGAMKVFRSVLEIAPGNAEALQELEEMERAFARITSSGRQTAVEPTQVQPRPPQAPPPAPEPTVMYVRPDRARGTAVPSAVTPPAAGPSATYEPTVVQQRPQPAFIPAATVPPAAAQPPPRDRTTNTTALVAAAIAAVLVIGVIAAYIVMSRRTAEPADTVAAGSVGAAIPAQAPPVTASIAPAVASPPASVEPPTAVITPPPPSGPAVANRGGQTPAREAPGGRSAPPPAKTDRPSTPETPAPVAAPTSSAPPAPTSPVAPVEPKPAAPANPVVTVKHFHGRALFKGKFSSGFCEGTLEILPDGLYFKTTTTTDNRKDDKKIPFAKIEDHEIDGDKIHIETDENTWDFGAPKDVLQQIEALLKAKVKS